MTTTRVAAATKTSPGKPPRAGRKRKRSRSLGTYLFILPAALFVVATTVYPLLYNVNLGFYDAPIQKFLRGTVEWVGLSQYQEALGDPKTWVSLGTSLVYTLATIALMLTVGTAFAILFTKTFPGNKLLRSLLFLPYILPSVVAANVWRWMLDGTSGLVNYLLTTVRIIPEPVFWLGSPTFALPAVILATAWTMVPFAMLLIIAGLQNIPRATYEAAELDGAGRWSTFWRITVPLLRPVLSVVALLGFIYTFKTFDTIFIMTRGGPGDATTVLPILAYNEAFVNFDLGSGATVNTLLLVIPMVLAIIYFRSTRKEG
ncbi:carbohydrate ABC transporter permease [Brachybacterium fresconis]|uniref:Multiple sugar transport system permease protein n=1 Tax=Brachybacterium fresconis TaxID=173363 RepID=A0ABS4YN85_9MICO|nr:sugar ABC transporter permease [Brachybacterium fresconis]MBP2410252.1 multiple sugar transport system permease protein [Brachybacterium fresconis]